MPSKGNQDETQTAAGTLACLDVRDLLHLFVTNELGEEFAPVCAHLTSCKECRKALAEHVKMAGMLTHAVTFSDMRYYSRNN